MSLYLVLGIRSMLNGVRMLKQMDIKLVYAVNGKANGSTLVSMVGGAERN